MNPPARRGAPAAIAIIGIIGLLNVFRNPRFATFHAADVIQLVASGMCFGIAFVTLLARFRASRA